jgi:hypothetical protein
MNPARGKITVECGEDLAGFDIIAGRCAHSSDRKEVMPRAPKSPSAKAAPAPKRPRQAAALSFPRKMNIHAFSHDAIAGRAYELFEEEGRPHGRDLEHWLMAEQELLSASAREAS